MKIFYFTNHEKYFILQILEIFYFKILEIFYFKIMKIILFTNYENYFIYKS
jgi:hypothetical protein